MTWKGDVKEFAKEVKIGLIRIEKTQKWLANELGVSMSFLADMLKGRRPINLKRKAQIEQILKG